MNMISFRRLGLPPMGVLLPSLIGACIFLIADSDRTAAQTRAQPDTLEAHLLSCHPTIGEPGFILPWGNYLLVSDWAGDPNLHALDRTTGELIASFGRMGSGPGEFVGLVDGIQLPSHDSAAWVFDGHLTRIATPGPIPSDATVVDLSAGGYPGEAAWLDSATIVGVKMHSATERLVFFDAAGNVVRTVPGEFLGHDGIPESERVEAGRQVALCAHPEGVSFALVYKMVGRIELYDRSASDMVNAAVPYPSEPRFDNIDGETRFIIERITYSSCWADSEFLYALYSGTDFGAAPSDAMSGREIHAFDWSTGSLVRMLHLDTPVFGFSLSWEDGWLYAGSPADAGIYRFSLGGHEPR